MNLKKLLELARQKALEAQGILEGETPDTEKANALLAEAEEYRTRAEAIQKAMGFVDSADETLKAIDEPTNSGIAVGAGEADKAHKANPFTSFGEFLMAVKNAGLNKMDPRLPPLRSGDAMDEGGFSIGKALGDGFVGGLVKSAHSKQSGLHEGLGATGGFLVGTDQGGSLMQRVYNVGDLLQRVDMVGISAGSNGMTFYGINETARANGSRRGGIRAYWTAEGGAKQESKPAFRELELRLHKVVGLVYATDELLEDANALETWIMNNLPEELRFVVEDAIINGTGTGMPQGILASGALVTQAAEAGQAADTVVSQNIMNMWSRLWAPSRRTAVWLINQDVEPQLYQLNLGVGTGGVALYQPPGGLSQAPYSTIMGRPVLASEYCDTVGDVGDIMLLDFNEYQMIEKGGMQSASSLHVRFVWDETLFRFVYRCDGISKWNSDLTPLYSAITQSPFIALEAR